MATLHRAPYTDPRWPQVRGNFVAESVSFTSSAGDQNSSRAVPAGKVWLLQCLRALNGEAADRELAFQLIDPDGLQYGFLSEIGTRITAGAGEQVGWDGLMVVPQLWTVRAYFFAMVGGSTCNWQYMAYEAIA